MVSLPQNRRLSPSFFYHYHIIVGFMIIILLLLLPAVHPDQTVSQVNPDKYSVAKDTRYLLYDVNHGEGFNLRRDVYGRVADTVRQLRKAGENFVLVLPPWGGLYHWKDRATQKKWSEYFDVDGMNRYVPVIEFEQFLQETKMIDHVVYLQHYAEGWGTEYVFRNDKRPCLDGQKYYKKNKDKWEGWFFGYNDVFTRKFECVSIQGDSKALSLMIRNNYKNERYLFIDRMETILHEHFGGTEFWRVRRSMRYAQPLVEIAKQYRKENLNSDDDSDKTTLPVKWEDKVERGAKGGPYLCGHLRRRDFLSGHRQDVPSIKGAAKQLRAAAKKVKVGHVFLATDAPDDEIDELRSAIGENVTVHLFRSDPPLGDGAAAIVEQIICSHARYFIGTHVSTFSYRIQEDREILGFPVDSTFNRMCPDNTKNCEQPAKWKIVY